MSAREIADANGGKMAEKMECGHPIAMLNVYWGKPSIRSDIYCTVCAEISDAKRQGAEEMRERAAIECERHDRYSISGFTYAAHVRALPLDAEPEEKA